MKNHYFLAIFGALSLASPAAAQLTIGTLVTNGLSEPYAIAVDANNNYFISDSANNRIAKYDISNGQLLTLAGGGPAGRNDATGIFASFDTPQGIVAARGGLVVADTGNHVLRFVALNGVVTTLAGGSPGSGNGNGTSAQFFSPAGLALDTNTADIYVADLGNNAIRKIAPNNDVTTVATGFKKPAGVAVGESGRLYVADTLNHVIKLVEPSGAVSVIAGQVGINGSQTDLFGTNALFNAPRGLFFAGPQSGLIVSDTGNGVLRRVYFNTNYQSYSVETFANSDRAGLLAPVGLARDRNDNLLVMDLGRSALRIVGVPQLPPLVDPQIGIVVFVTNQFGDVSTILRQVISSSFNNDPTIAILTEANSEAHYTSGKGGDPAIIADPSAGTSVSEFYQNGQPNLPASNLRNNIQHSDFTIKAISTAIGRRPSQIVSARFQFVVGTPVIGGLNPANIFLTNVTRGAGLRYTTDGSDPVESESTANLFSGGGRLDLIALDLLSPKRPQVLLKVRGFRNGYIPSNVVSNLYTYQDFLDQASRIGLQRDFTAGVGSTIVVPVEVKLATNDTLQSMQFRVEVIPNSPDTPRISRQFRVLTISTNDFISVPLPSTNSPNATVYTNGPITGLAISYLSQSALTVSNSGVVAMLAVPIPGSASVNQSYTIHVVQPSATRDGRLTPITLLTNEHRTITVTNRDYIVGDTAAATWYNAGEFGNGNLNNNDVNSALLASLGLFAPYSFTDAFDAMDAFPIDTLGSAGGDGQIRFLDWQVILQRSLRLDTDNWIRRWSPGGTRRGSRTNLTEGANSPSETFDNAISGQLWRPQAEIRGVSQGNVMPGSLVSVPVFVKVTSGASLAGLQFRALIQSDANTPALDQAVRFVAGQNVPAPLQPNATLPINQVAAAWSPLVNPFSSALVDDQFLGHIQFAVPASASPGQIFTLQFVNADGSPDLQSQYDLETKSATISVAAPVLSTSADSGVRGYKLRWHGAPGVRYTVESSPDLARWNSEITDLFGRGNWLEFIDKYQTGNARFYRIRSE